MAVILIHQHPNLRDTALNENTDRPTINIEKIGEVSSLKLSAKKSKTNFRFYPEDEE